MLTTINNYKVKRLLLNGHYVCSSAADPDSLYLLCHTKTKLKRSLRNYKLLHLHHILFPMEITILSQGDTFDCFCLPESLSLCMIKLQSKSYSSPELILMFINFCKSLPEIIEHDVLRKEILSCLCWDNLWMSKKELMLVWYPDKKQAVTYNQETLIEKLVEVLKMMHLTILNKSRDNAILKSIVGFLRSNPTNPPTLKEFLGYLEDVISIKPIPNLKQNRYSPVKISKLDMNRNRFSIDYAQQGVERSLRFIKSNRKKTIDVTDHRKRSLKLGKFSLFDSFKKNTSPSNNSRSKERSFSKDLTNYRMDRMVESSEGDTIRTESGNLRISNLLRNRAIEAFEIQKKKSIEATRFTPDKARLISASKANNTSTWRQYPSKEQKMRQKHYTLQRNQSFGRTQQLESLHSEKFVDYYSNKQQLTSSLKMKMLKFHKKKEGDDKIMRVFNSNRHNNKMSCHVELPLRIDPEMLKDQYTNPKVAPKREIHLDGNANSLTLPNQEVPSHSFPKLQINNSEKMSGPRQQLPVQRNIFHNDFVREERSQIRPRENTDMKSIDSKEPSEIRELMQRLGEAPVIIRTVNSEVEFEKEKTEIDYSVEQRQGSKIKEKSILKPKKQEIPQPQSQETGLKSIKSVRIQQFQKPLKNFQVSLPSPQPIPQPQKIVPPQPSLPLNQRKRKQTIQSEEIQEIILESKIKTGNTNASTKTNIKDTNYQKQLDGKEYTVKNNLMIPTSKTNEAIPIKKVVKQELKKEEKGETPQQKVIKQKQEQVKEEIVSTRQKQKTEEESRLETLKSSTKSKQDRNDSQLKRTISMQVKLETDAQPSQSLKSNKASLIETRINQYIDYINLMGEAVSKSRKVCKNLQSNEWFTGIYFMYKRFLRQRMKIEQWLQDGVRKFKRDNEQELDKESFEKWLISQRRNILLKKIKEQNQNISESIAKMNKTLSKKCINKRVLNAANLDKEDPHESNLMMEKILEEYDELVENQVGEDIKRHLVQLLDGALIVAELDGKTVPYLVDLKARKEMVDIGKYFSRQQSVVDELALAYNIE